MLTLANKIKLIVLGYALISSTIATAECSRQTASQLISQHSVSAPYDVEKEKGSGQCTVKFKIDVEGQTKIVIQTVKGMEPDEILCHRAIAQGRSDLLVNMGGMYRTESINSCSNTNLGKFVPVKIGQVILENDVLPVPGIDRFWKYGKTTCRLFQEKYAKTNRVIVNHGVICETDNGWVVVDKW